MSCDGNSNRRTARLWPFAAIALIAAPLAVALHSRPSEEHEEPRGNTLSVQFVVPPGVRLPDATVVLHAGHAGDPLEFDIEQRMPLTHDGVTFRGVTPGAKRVQLLDAGGRTLVLHKVCLDRSAVAVDVPLAPLRLFGRLTDHDDPAPGVSVEFVHPEHPAVVLASARTDAGGRYETTIWQRGDVIAYPFEDKPVSCSMFARLTLGIDDREYEFDMRIPSAALTLLAVDAASGEPIPRAEVDRWIRNAADDLVHAGKAMTDDRGVYRLTRHRDGTATFLVKAPGYRLAEVQETLREDEHAELRVALQRAVGTGGHVYGPDGAPIAGAVVMGGYPGDRRTNPILRARTGADGEFNFTSDPEDDMPFYAIAPGHALAVTTLRVSDDNVIQLEPLNDDGTLRVLTRNGTEALPSRRLRVAPAGGSIVPEHVLADLAGMNGSTLLDIIRTDSQGSSPLPRYLSRGAWAVYVRAERSDDVQPIGLIHTPLFDAQVLTADR